MEIIEFLCLFQTNKLVKYVIELAKREDDSALKACLKDNEMNGAISIAFETEPSYFDALEVQGKTSQVVAIKTEQELIGFGVRAIKPAHINGDVLDIGYLSGLRGYKKFRGGLFLARGYQFFRELDQDGRVPFYLTTIIEDNIQARTLLESGRAGLPKYNPFGALSTFVIKPQRNKIKKKNEIVRGGDVSLDAIINFMHNEGKNKQFYPYYERSDFGSKRLRGLNHEDFYVALKDDEVVGIVAKWDQEAFKQTRVVGYDKKTRFGRPLINFASRFSDIPHLPKEGELLHYFYAAFPTTKDNDPQILEELLSVIASDTDNKRYDYFTLGIAEQDPLREAVKSFSPREYRSIIYVVSFDKSSENLKFLNGRIPYLELGTL